MNIAHIIPEGIILPLKQPNGRYDWVVTLARAQIDSGHTVTIYCNNKSSIDGIQTLGIDSSSTNKRGNNIATFRLAFSNNHDIYHSHLDNLHYEVASETNQPIVFTQHWWPYDETLDLAGKFQGNNLWAVPPTQYMLRYDNEHGIKTKGHIYHGIDHKIFKTQVQPGNSNRLLFVGRISPEKNVELAIEAALKAGKGLDIVGKLSAKYPEYVDHIMSLVDGETIRYLGTKTTSQMVYIYNQALGLIMPSNTREAFGLVIIEAQACGLPVIMKRGGSGAELIIDTKTGYLCDTVADFSRAINNLGSISRSYCNKFAKRFTIEGMSQNYEKLYASLIY